MDETDGAWFAPKRFGIGTGRPIVWQGWAFSALHGAVLILGVLLLRHQHQRAMVAWLLIFTLLPLPVYAAKTRGGLKWRWGSRD